ncbi:hypothetical protein QAD02_005698, partial [Eretmocerus hayati]
RHLKKCHTQSSPLQAVQNLLEHIVWASARYYETLMMAQHLKEELTDLSPDEQIGRQLETQISTWYNNTIGALANDLKGMSRKLYICNLPDTSRRGSFIHLRAYKRVFTRQTSRSRAIICSPITHIDRCETRYELERKVCAVGPPCHGEISGCTDVNHLSVCKKQEHMGVFRDIYGNIFTKEYMDRDRYQFYYNHKEESKPSNEDNNCTIQDLSPQSNNLYVIRNVKVIQHHTSCQCFCQEEGEYEINLAPTRADPGMVVIGAKFVLDHKILEIHIQQGKILPFGKIDQRSIQWKGPTELDIEKVTPSTRIVLDERIGMLDFGKTVTGLGLAKSGDPDQNEASQDITLKVMYSDYNYEKGILHGYQPLIRTPTVRDVINLDQTSPLKAPATLKVTLIEKGFVNFTVSNGKDGGQSTIPFFDAQEVTSNKPGPLSGAALYWKGGEQSSGFIGIRLETYQTSPFILKSAGVDY